MNDYRSVPALNYSTLKVFAESPRLYEAQFIRGAIKQKSSDEMHTGIITHRGLLEPTCDLLEGYAIKPDGMSFATNEGKAWKAENEGKNIIPFSDFEAACKAIDAVRNHREASNLLNMATSFEESVFWLDERTKIDCKARLDARIEGQAIIDLKTTKDATPEAYLKRILQTEYRYDLQAAWYSIPYPGYRWFWIVVETSEPYRVRVYEPSEGMLDLAAKEVRKLLDDFAIRQASNDWRDPDEEIVTQLDFPTWFYRKSETK